MNTSSQEIITLIIPLEYANQRLDQSMCQLLSNYSRTQIKHWITAGELLVNGQTAKASMKVKGGENVSITVKAHEIPLSLAENIALEVIYEDEALMLINKPVGLVVHPGAGNPNQTLLNALLHHTTSLAEVPRAGILHRLDKDTSGLLLIAKTPPIFQQLSQHLAQRTLIRQYQAIVSGNLLTGGRIDAPIGRHHLKRKQMAVTSTGKKAITHYRIIERFRYHTHLLVKLETGRTHQIRVHLASIHHPIVGDQTYGGRLKIGKNMLDETITELRHFKRQALHAFSLGFSHPITEEWMQFEVELPNDMKKLLNCLRKDNAQHP